MIYSKVQQYIDAHQLTAVEDKLVIALSGGADSVALLEVLLHLNYCVEAAHCNFHLRDKESDRDEKFVRKLCKELKVKLHVAKFDTKAYADQHQLSIEMAAREQRYSWFEELREKIGAKAIAVAHHRDDSNETLLLNLIRGTGLTGLLGIRPKNGYVIRPLLCVGRQDILDFLESIHQPYVTDSTNLQDDFIRNKIRLHLIPLMETINPSVKLALEATASHLTDVAKIYNQVISEGRMRVMTEHGIVIEWLMEEPSPRALLFEILHPLGFASGQIEDIFGSLNGESGRSFTCVEWKAVKDREYLLLQKKTEVNVVPQIEQEKVSYTKNFVIPKEHAVACLDAERVKYPITVRKWEIGDKFIPFGMKGKKLISDYMTDKKFSLLQKEKQFVACSGDDIIWVIGERSDNRFRVTDTTKEILLLRVKIG
jgi:tRNA(Ile)-lysidine synthase